MLKHYYKKPTNIYLQSRIHILLPITYGPQIFPKNYDDSQNRPKSDNLAFKSQFYNGCSEK